MGKKVKGYTITDYHQGRNNKKVTKGIKATSHKAALEEYIKMNNLDVNFVEMTTKWVDENLPGVYGLDLVDKISFDVSPDNDDFGIDPRQYIVVDKDYKEPNKPTTKKYKCKDSNGTTLHEDEEVMCHISEDGEINEYQGYVMETLPDNKVKVNAEERIMIVNASDVYSLMF